MTANGACRLPADTRLETTQRENRSVSPNFLILRKVQMSVVCGKQTLRSRRRHA